MVRSYFIMDYAEKGDLIHYVKANYDLYDEKEKEKFCKIIFKKILEGIQFCHDNNYCHLDIKLNNILLDDKFNPIITDFGLPLKLRKNGELRRFGGKIGTKNICVLKCLIESTALIQDWMLIFLHWEFFYLYL